MRRTLQLAICTPFLLAWPLAAAPPDNTPRVDVAQVRTQLLGATYIEGTLTDVKLQDEEGLVTVQYTYRVQRRVDPIAVKRAEILKKIYEKVVESKFEPAIQKVGEELAKAQRDASATVDFPIPFTLKIDKSVKLRTLVVPLDDSGKPRRFTPEEYQKRKGNPSLPGLLATDRDFELGQSVRFFLDRAKMRAGPVKNKVGAEEKAIYPIAMLVLLPAPKAAPGNNPFLEKK